MGNLLEIPEALDRLLQHFQRSGTISIKLDASSGLVLARDIHSDVDLPPFSNSSMDGFTLIAKDTVSATADAPVKLVVVEDIPAGAMPHKTLHTGQAARIMTGAALPPGADAVIPLEETKEAKTTEPDSEVVLIQRPCRSGEYIRNQGQDVRKGQLIFSQGKRLNPQDVGMLASLGYGRVPVFKKPSVAILSSGDELVAPGSSLKPGQVRDSNTYMLQALVEKHGGKALKVGVAPDRLEEVRKLFERAVELDPDLILTSAGVSVGTRDYVRDVIEQSGHLEFWRVNMRPGKPLAFGSYNGIPVIGLPGNPVSAFVGFQVFVKPALEKMAGLPTNSKKLPVILREALSSDGRQSYMRGIVWREQDSLFARLAGEQGSGNLFSLTQANALLIMPSGVKSLAVGNSVEAWLIVDEIL